MSDKELSDNACALADKCLDDLIPLVNRAVGGAVDSEEAKDIVIQIAAGIFSGCAKAMQVAKGADVSEVPSREETLVLLADVYQELRAAFTEDVEDGRTVN